MDPGIFVRGGGGGGGWGGPGQSDKKSSDVFFCFFLSPQLINFKAIYRFSRFQRGSNIFQWGPTFSRGVPIAYSL